MGNNYVSCNFSIDPLKYYYENNHIHLDQCRKCKQAIWSLVVCNHLILYREEAKGVGKGNI